MPNKEDQEYFKQQYESWINPEDEKELIKNDD